MEKMYFVLIVFFLIILPVNVYGFDEEDKETVIFITQSDFMTEIVFDGKWTSYLEWKNTSWNPIKSDNVLVYHLRSAHQGDSIYLFLDVISDEKFNAGMDKAMICIDTKNNKNEFFDTDDYCFIVSLQENNFFGKLFRGKNSIILQGNSVATSFEELKQITASGFIGIGTMSDDEDRYSSMPHASYEFKIPTELIGRSDNYGFFVTVFDSEKNTVYSWPENINLQKFEIPSPTKWGNLISPDKSLPEFELPLLIIFSSIIILVIVSRVGIGKINIALK